MTGTVVAWALGFCRGPRAMLAILCVCAIAALQVVHLPGWVLEVVAPLSARLWRQASDGGPSTWHTVSVDPAATAVGIRRMFLWMSMVAAVRDAARDRTARVVLVSALGLSAVLVCALAAAFPVDKSNPKLLGTYPVWGRTTNFWMNGDRLPVQSDGGGFLTWERLGDERYLYDLPMAGDGVGPFWSSSQIACTLVVTLPFLVAACIVASRHAGSSLPGYAAGLLLAAGGAWFLWGIQARAGIVSLVVACCLFLQAIVTGRLTSRCAGLATIICLAGFLLFVAAFTGALPDMERFAPAEIRPHVHGLLSNPRTQGTWAAATMLRGSPLNGVGINGYEAVYPIVRPADFAFYYAYNEYAQLAAEAGIVGCLLALGLAWPLSVALWRSRGANGSGQPFAAATVAALAGVASNMFFEWSLHQPANGLLSGVIVGLATALGEERQGAPTAVSRVPAGIARGVGWGFAVVCVLTLTTLARDAHSDVVWREFRQALEVARSLPWRGERPDPVPLLERALERGERAAAWDPRNPRLALVRGQAHLHLTSSGEEVVRRSHRAYADDYFRRVKRMVATTIGLPEPIPAAVP